MSHPHLRIAVWLVVIFAAVIAIDKAAGAWVVWARKSYIHNTAHEIDGSWRLPFTREDEMYDGSIVRVVTNRMTGTSVTTVIRPATWWGLCRVWWPAVASGLLTLLAVAIAVSRQGQALIARIPLPVMSTRRLLTLITILGTEGGLVIGTLKTSGIDPMRTPWVPIFYELAIVHVVAFLPVFVVLPFRRLRRLVLTWKPMNGFDAGDRLMSVPPERP
jgi:hypothetical protein